MYSYIIPLSYSGLRLKLKKKKKYHNKIILKKKYRAIDEKNNVPGGKNPAPPGYQMERPLPGPKEF